MITEEKDNGREILFGDVFSGDDSRNDIPDHEADSVSDPWSAIESGIFGDVVNDFALGYSPDEEDLDRPLESSEALILAALRNIPNTRKGRLGSGSSLVEEFDDVGEQVAYLLIQENVRNCFVDCASKKEQTAGIKWVFTKSEDQ